MFLHEIELKQFRCFEKKIINFKKQITLITGNNGTGKTSLAEAIHYLCYLKSFRSHIVSELVSHESDTFFLKGLFSTHSAQDLLHQLQVGYKDKKKAIKLDNKSITSYKEIFQLFQVITILEDDINLIKGYPQNRRTFMDQGTLFFMPSYLDKYRNFRRILQSRNAFLAKGYKDKLEADIWTEQLWNSSKDLQNEREKTLEKIEVIVNGLLETFFENVYKVTFQYQSRYINKHDTFDQFLLKRVDLLYQEQLYKRSLFGAHLDDVIIQIKDKRAREYASRGQQKLVSLLCKMTFMKLAENNDFLPILLLDDFIADFDQKRLKQIINFLVSCKNQVIITTPIYDQDLIKIIGSVDPDVIFMN